MTTPETFRPPTDSEKAIFDRLLSAAFPGKERLQEQLAEATVSVIDVNGSMALRVTGDRVAEVTKRIPVEAEYPDTDGVPVHVLLHVVKGKLDELEIYREDSLPLKKNIDPQQLQLLVLG